MSRSRWARVATTMIGALAVATAAAGVATGTATPADAQDSTRFVVPRHSQHITLGPCRPDPVTSVPFALPKENGQTSYLRLPWLAPPDPTDGTYRLREDLGQRDLTRYEEPWSQSKTTYAAPYFHTTEQTQVRWTRASVTSVGCARIPDPGTEIERPQMVAVVEIVSGEGRVKTVNWNDAGLSSRPLWIRTTPWPSDR